MSLIRLLFLIGIIYIAYRLVRKLAENNNSSISEQKTTSMVRCAFCNVYVIKQEACFRDNNYYCNPEHYEQAINNKLK